MFIRENLTSPLMDYIMSFSKYEINKKMTLWLLRNFENMGVFEK